MSTSATQSELLTPTTRRLTVTVLAAGVGAFGLLQSMVVPVLTEIQHKFDTDQSTVTWVLTAYLLSAAVATPIIGRVGDSVGKQRMLFVTLAVLSLGSLMAAFAPTIGWMIVARVIQGVGGGVMPLAFGIIRDEVPPAKAGAAIGLVASLASAAFGIGIVVSGPIVDHLGFRWLFLLPMVATVLAAIGTLVVVPESPVRRAGRVSLTPAVFLAGWLVCLLLGISRGNAWGWTSAGVLGLFAATVVLVVAWIMAEQRVAVPLIDLEMMRVRGVWTANLVVLLVGFSIFASFGFLPQLLQTPTSTGYGFGDSISQSGWVLLPGAVLSFVMGTLSPHLQRWVDVRITIFIGTMAAGSAYLLIALLHDHTWQIATWMGLQGFGTGLVVSSLARVVLGSVRPDQSGVATGMNANIRLIGGSIGSAVMGGIVTAHAGAGGFPLERGYRDGFLVLAGAIVLAGAASLLIPNAAHRRRLRPSEPQTVVIEAGAPT